MSQKKTTTNNGMASIEIPKYLLDGEHSITPTLYLDKDGHEAGYGFFPDVSMWAYSADCPRCHGQVTVLHVPPAHCYYCGAALEGEPRRFELDIWQPDDLEASMRMQGKPMLNQHDALRDALKEAIADFLGERLEASGAVVLPKGAA